MPERFVIWGAGGHGRVVHDVLVACGDEVVGFVDRNPPGSHLSIGGAVRLPVASEAELAGGTLPFGATAVACGVGDCAGRLAGFLAWSGRHRSPARVHPSAILGTGVQVGEGSVVMPGVVINAGARIGRAAIVNTSAVVEHDCVLDDGVHVSPGAVLCGDVQVGRATWIGAGAVIIPGRRLGAGVTVGAGSTVLVDVPDGTTVVGSPARPTRIRSTS